MQPSELIAKAAVHRSEAGRVQQSMVLYYGKGPEPKLHTVYRFTLASMRARR
eukprot:COSAG01_NODE_50996_length_358_cov_1.204633_2_plen_51_part_01